MNRTNRFVRDAIVSVWGLVQAIASVAAAYWQRNILRAAFAWLFPPGV